MLLLIAWFFSVPSAVVVSRGFFATYALNSGYSYPHPEPPIQFDEPSTPPNIYGPPHYYPNISFPPLQDEPAPIVPTYVPPSISNPLPAPGSELQPPQFDPIPTDDTIIIPPINDQYLPPTSLYGTPKLPLQLTVINMSCLDSATKKFFRADIRTSQFLDFAPVVDDSSVSDCVFGLGDRFRVDLESNKLTQCGVRYCSRDRTNLCVTLRMATVRGLKLPEDSVVTLQCRPQESVVAHTKQFRLNSQSVQGRSAATVASGGSQRNFDTQVGLFRKSSGSNEFTQAVIPGTAVQLGEDLLLRASVREGDGWKFSRMGAVVMHRIAPVGLTKTSARVSQNSAILVDNLGCRSPSMKSVCPEHPRQVSPLITTLPFRAFMFQGAKSGDEMVLSVRMVGCLQFEDCNQGRSCDDKNQVRSRSKRDTTKTDNITDWQSYLEFKVVLPGHQDHESTTQYQKTSFIKGLTIFGAFLAILFLLLIFLVVVFLRKK